jgi:hypothetical protein
MFSLPDPTIQRTATSAEACVGNNITPLLECTNSTVTGVLAAAQRKHNNQHQPKRLDFFLLPFNGRPVLNAPPRYYYQTAATLQANAPLTSLLLLSFNLFHSQPWPLLLLEFPPRCVVRFIDTSTN